MKEMAAVLASGALDLGAIPETARESLWAPISRLGL
jgi:hypothetical protein